MKRFALVLLVCLASCKAKAPAEQPPAAVQPATPSTAPAAAQAPVAPAALVADPLASMPLAGADRFPKLAPRLKEAADKLSPDRMARFIAFQRAVVGKGALSPFVEQTPETEAARQKSGMSWDELRDLSLLTSDYYPSLRIIRESEANLADLRARAKSSKDAADELAVMEPVYKRQEEKLQRQKQLYGEKALAILDAVAGQYFELQDQVFGPVR